MRAARIRGVRGDVSSFPFQRICLKFEFRSVRRLRRSQIVAIEDATCLRAWLQFFIPEPSIKPPNPIFKNLPLTSPRRFERDAVIPFQGLSPLDGGQVASGTSLPKTSCSPSLGILFGLRKFLPWSPPKDFLRCFFTKLVHRKVGLNTVLSFLY